MKNIKKISITAVFIIFTAFAFAQTPPPPNNNGGGSSSPGNTPVGGGAPIGGGIVILVSVAIAYGYAKYYLKEPDYTVENKF